VTVRRPPHVGANRCLLRRPTSPAKPLRRCSGPCVSRVRVHELEMTEPQFAARVQLLPTPGLWNELGMQGIRWWWDEFDCGPEFWARGPVIVETFYFGEVVEAVLRYCESLIDPQYTPERRHEIDRAMCEYRQATLEPHLHGNLELFWNDTSAGSVSDHRLESFPSIHGRLEVTELNGELREALRWYAQQVEKPLHERDDEVGEPFADELFEGWWLRAPDGTRLEVYSMPIVNFQEQTLEWCYSRRFSG